MAEATKTSKGTSGYVSNGVFGGICAVTDNLLTDTAQHIPDRSGLKLSIFHFSSVANTNTWTSEIKNAVACAWQPEDATDDDVRVSITAYTAGGARARGGAVFTFVAGGTRSGWLWVLHGS